MLGDGKSGNEKRRTGKHGNGTCTGSKPTNFEINAVCGCIAIVQKNYH